jgi:hypothetical protein
MPQVGYMEKLDALHKLLDISGDINIFSLEGKPECDVLLDRYGCSEFYEAA